ncbi:MAG: hypothetical protein LBE48_04810, partial [Methanomassiliicoccaceae archaeon]|nr:hypothetical protein [Methanomassiliicoccaceae archaeon]
DGLWDKPGMAYDPLKTPGNMQGITGWASFPEFGSNAWWFLVSTILLGVGIGALAQPQLAARFMTAKDTKTLNKSLWIGAIFMIVIVGTAYTVGALTNLYFAETYGLNAMDHITKINGKFNLDLVIPTFVNDIFGSMGTTGELFIVIFVFALICAATSTMCALLHTMGAAAGYDLWSETEKKFKNKQITKPSIKVTRIATVAMMVVVIILAYLMPPSIIAKATSMFMGLTAAAILPAYGHAVFAKKPNMLAAKLSIIVGSMIWFVWALFVCEGIGGILAPGVLPLVSGQIIYVDPLILALPISIVVLVLTCYLKPAKGEGEDGNEDKERPKEKDLALDG